MTFQDGDWKVPNQRFTFTEWKERVSKRVERETRIHPDDLPHWPYDSAYRNGVTPEAAANAVIKSAKTAC